MIRFEWATTRTSTIHLASVRQSIRVNVPNVANSDKKRAALRAALSIAPKGIQLIENIFLLFGLMSLPIFVFDQHSVQRRQQENQNDNACEDTRSIIHVDHNLPLRLIAG